MIFERKKGCKVICASCKKDIKEGDMIAFSTTISGLLKVHHHWCKDE